MKMSPSESLFGKQLRTMERCQHCCKDGKDDSPRYHVGCCECNIS